MEYTKVKIISISDNLDIIIGILYDLEINNFVESNQEEEYESKDWTDDREIDKTIGNRLEIEIYLEKDEIYKLQQLRNCLFEIVNIIIEVESIENEDWANSWKKYYKILRFANNIVVQPAWEEYIPAENEVVIKLNAGMAFGSGTHQTTEMCIGLIKKYIKPGDKVIDVGTGTGILAILASKLGATQILATEIDENLLNSTRENIELNNVNNIKLECSNLLYNYSGIMSDLIVANIIAEIDLEIAKDIRDNLKTGGILILSAISDDKLEIVKNVLKDFEILEIKNLDDWNTIVLKY